MDQLKNIQKFCDLYGWELTVLQLKKLFSLVSWCKNSKPTPGSLCLPTKKLKENNDTIIKKAMVHKNGNFTLVTNQGWLTFSN